MAEKQMKAVVLQEYTGASGLVVEEVERPEPKAGEVLIEVAASAINPSDFAFLHGQYSPRPPVPTRAGFEGSGTVVAVGAGPMGRFLLGKRVAFVMAGAGGAWAEYVVVPARLALPLGDDVSFEAGAMSVVNPMTALAFLEIAGKGGHKAVVNTAAAGALGRMIDLTLTAEGVTVINVVRRPEQVEMLKAAGSGIVLDSSSDDFDSDLKATCREHGADLALDAIAGDMTGRLLAGLVRGGEVLVYGGLSNESPVVGIDDLIFKEKRVNGFWLTHWLPRKNPAQALRLWRKVQNLVGESLGSRVQATYPLERAAEAVDAYLSAMSDGKVLIVPRLN